MNEVLRQVPAPDLRAYVIWLPVLDGDDEAAARASAARLSDLRVRHYWDGTRAFGTALGRTLTINPSQFEPGQAFGLAWDVYLLYPRTARWDATIPAPGFWMHQLHQLPPGKAPEFEARAFRAQVEAAIRSRP